MKLLTKNTDYAVRALLVLADNQEGFISVRFISVEQNVPYEYLRKIIQQFIKAGWVESKEGASGGVKLIKSPVKIRLSDIIELFQGVIELSECMFQDQFCLNRSKCVLRKQIQRIEKIMVNGLQDITIASLLSDLQEAA